MASQGSQSFLSRQVAVEKPCCYEEWYEDDGSVHGELVGASHRIRFWGMHFS